MSDSFNSIHYADIEARARAMRAEAARDGLIAMRKAVSHFFGGLFAGRKTAS